jgi:hypothetical protein
MHNRFVLGMLSVIIFFSASHAADAAGFAKQSLFLSQATVSESETVFIYAVVTNDTVSYFNGTLVFSDEDGAIGTTSVALASDRANAFSVSWQPHAGQHTVTAQLRNAAGDVVESENSLFFVDPKRQPAVPSSPQTTSKKQAASTTEAADTSEPIVRAIASVSPFFAQQVAPTLATVDAGRAKAVDSLHSGTAWSEKQIIQSALAKSGFMNTLWLILSTLVLYVCTAVAYVLANIGVFYPVAALIFFFVLWRLYRMMRR